MKNRRERQAIARQDYVAATWCAAEHYARFGKWAMGQAVQGHAIDFTKSTAKREG